MQATVTDGSIHVQVAYVAGAEAQAPHDGEVRTASTIESAGLPPPEGPRAEPGRPPPDVRIRPLELPSGATLSDALASLGDPMLNAAIESGALMPALFGERVRFSQTLRDGDRIELLGPLVADPKQSRGRRAEVQRARRGDARWGRR